MSDYLDRWLNLTIASVAIMAGIIGAWIRDRLSINSRIVKLETNVDHIGSKVDSIDTKLDRLLDHHAKRP